MWQIHGHILKYSWRVGPGQIVYPFCSANLIYTLAYQVLFMTASDEMSGGRCYQREECYGPFGYSMCV